MPKKRRLNDDQARLLAIKFLQQAVANEVEFGSQIIPPDIGKGVWYFKDCLPPNWQDGNTSEKSWDLLWEEMRLQLLVIMKGLDREALRVKMLNPDFQYTTLFPIAPKTLNRA